jgi:tetratricopeptide (TPR) repeat protein
MSSGGQTFEELVANARMLRQKGETKKAILQLQKALQIRPDAVDVMNELGLAHIHIGEQSEAIIVFDTALDIKPDDEKAHLNRAEAFLTLGSFEEALNAAETGLSHVPESAGLYSKKGRALESLMRIQDAIDAFNESLKYDSDNPETWKALALCLDAQAKWTEVARAYRIAAALHEKRGEMRDAESCMKFAEMAESSIDEMA